MTAAQKKTVGVAVASLVLGILGFLMLGPIGAIPAVICGHVAKSKIKKNPEELGGDGMALAGLIMGYVYIGLMILMIPLMAAIAIPAFVSARDVAVASSCVNNLRQMDAAKEMWAIEYGAPSSGMVDADAASQYIKGTLTCSTGGEYTFNEMDVPSTCSAHPASEATSSQGY